MGATANRVSLLRVKETSLGVAPSGSPALKPIRFTGGSFNEAVKTESSKEIRSDRQVTDHILVDSTPGGSFNFELSMGTFDDEIEAAMASAWGTATNATVTGGTITTGTGVVTAPSGTPFVNIVVGQWVKLTSTSSPTNDGFYKVSAKTSSTSITLSPAPGTTDATANYTVKGTMIRNGVTRSSFQLFQNFTDLSPVISQRFIGQVIDQLMLDIKAGSILTGSVAYKGMSAAVEDDATELLAVRAHTGYSSATIDAATTSDVLNAVSNVTGLQQAGVSVLGSIMSMTMTLNNKVRENKAVGVLGNADIPLGTLEVGGNISQYFADKAQLDRLLRRDVDAGYFSLSYRFEATSGGSALIMTIPSAVYTSLTTNAGGLDTDVMAEGQWAARRDPVTNCMIQFDKF